MARVAKEADSELVADFRFVERVRELFRVAGIQLSFWEAHCLSQSSRPALRRVIERSEQTVTPPDVPTEVLESLRLLRSRGLPIISKLRTSFLSRPRTAEGEELLEMALAVIVGSDKGREAAARWVEDPMRHAEEATERLRSIMDRLKPVRRALRGPGGGTTERIATRRIEIVKPESPPMEPAPVPSLPRPIEASPPAAKADLPVDQSPETAKPAPEAPALPARPVFPEPEPVRPEEYPPPLPIPIPTPAAAESKPSPPGAPQGIEASTDHGLVELAWSPVPGATEYRVKRSDTTVESFRTIASPQNCAYIDDAVTPGAGYLYRLSARNGVGEGADSPPVRVKVPRPPEAPEGLAVAAGNARIKLSWDLVPGARAYHIKRTTIAEGTCVQIATVEWNSFVDEGVRNGSSYRYVVSAVGPGGESPDSAPVEAVPHPPPAPPAQVQAAAGDVRVSLTWSAVPGAAGYAVRRSVGEGSDYAVIALVDGASYVDRTVTNGTLYRYVVRSSNAFGESVDSDPAAATPVAPPPAPTELKISTDLTRLRIEWSAVPGATSYILKRAASPGGPFQAIASNFERTLKDDVPPERGKEFFYVVSAKGPGGEGPDSLPVAKVLPAPPPAPGGVGAVSGNGRVSLSWSPSTGASRYHVKRRPAEGGKAATIATPNAPPYVDTSVTNGEAYIYVVSAVSGAGEGADSSPVEAEPLSPPPAPSGLLARPGNARVSLSWQASPGAVEYRVQRTSSREAHFVDVARLKGVTAFEDANVSNGEAYDYVVLAYNAGGRSPTSTRARATPMSPPAAPGKVESSAGHGRVLLAWDAAPTASSYEVKRAISAEGPYAVQATVQVTTYTDTSVENGTTYYYRVAASNAGGQSGDTAAVRAMPIDRPFTPGGLTAVPAEGKLLLSWQASPGASSYAVKRATSAGGPFTTLATVEGTSHVDQEVDHRSTYWYTVSAMNPAGRSAPSGSVSASPKPKA